MERHIFTKILSSDDLKVNPVSKKFKISGKLPKMQQIDEQSEKAKNKPEEKDNVLGINTNPDLRPYTSKRAYEDYVLVEEDNVIEGVNSENNDGK